MLDKHPVTKSDTTTAATQKRQNAIVGHGLLDILNLLLQPVDRSLDLDRVPSDRGVVRLACDRVGFAEHFLRDEVELAAGVIAVAAGILKCLQMVREPLDF